jgi:hypothetical protein
MFHRCHLTLGRRPAALITDIHGACRGAKP